MIFPPSRENTVFVGSEYRYRRTYNGLCSFAARPKYKNQCAWQTNINWSWLQEILAKKKEIEHLLRELQLNITFLPDYGNLPEVEEDQSTLEGNAEKKARVIREYLSMPSLADDTGLEVDALGGRPGVYSARYAGEACDPCANRALLLKELLNKNDRKARFRTVLAYAIEDQVYHFEGVCEGQITKEEAR